VFGRVGIDVLGERHRVLGQGQTGPITAFKQHQKPTACGLTAGWTAIDFGLAASDSSGVGAAIGVAATLALRLRQQRVDRSNGGNRVAPGSD